MLGGLRGKRVEEYVQVQTTVVSMRRSNPSGSWLQAGGDEADQYTAVLARKHAHTRYSSPFPQSSVVSEASPGGLAG